MRCTSVDGLTKASRQKLDQLAEENRRQDLIHMPEFSHFFQSSGRIIFKCSSPWAKLEMVHKLHSEKFLKELDKQMNQVAERDHQLLNAIKIFVIKNQTLLF
jgi:hypothetical protein